MKYKHPIESNKQVIKTCLEETFLNRRNWIMENEPAISEIFDMYPRLIDFNGEMVINNMYIYINKHFLTHGMEHNFQSISIKCNYST